MNRLSAHESAKLNCERKARNDVKAGLEPNYHKYGAVQGSAFATWYMAEYERFKAAHKRS